MNTQEKIEKAKDLFREMLGLSAESKEIQEEIKLEVQKIADQDVSIEAESFEAGSEVFIISGEERVPLPVGEYQLENGSVLVVEQEGVIGSIGEAQEEQPVEEVVEEEQEMAEEAQPKKVVESVSKEIHFSEDELKTMVKAWFHEFANEKAEEVEVKEEVELSEQVPTAKPIKHSPEKPSQKESILLGKNRPMTIAEKILLKQLNRK